HGLTEEVLKKQPKLDLKDPEAAKKGMKQMLEPIKDKNAFVADMMTAMKKLGGDKKDSGPMGKDAELKDVKIEGDTATGTVVTKHDGKEKSEAIKFRKVGGGWKIELPADMLKGP